MPSLHYENKNEKQVINKEKDKQSSFDKALESAEAKNLFDELSDEDFDEAYDEGYFYKFHLK